MLMSDTIKVVEKGLNSVIADIDDLIDQFIVCGYRLGQYDLKEIIQDAKPSHLYEARRYYKELYDEISSCEEGYEHLSPEQKDNYIKFLRDLIEYISAPKSRVIKKPRKSKAKTPEQIVKGIKYLKKDPETGVESIEPTKLVGSTSLWVFNTKVRRLSKYVSLPGTTLSLKGTTILNMDETKSVSKTLRKPEVDLPIFATDAKNMIETKFSKIKAKEKVPNGRINKDTLLIRAFK